MCSREQGASTAGLTVGDASKQHLATSRHQVCVTKCNKPHSSYKWRRTRALSGFQAMSAPQLIAQPSQPPHKSFTTALRDGRESVEEEAVRAEAQVSSLSPSIYPDLSFYLSIGLPAWLPTYGSIYLSYSHSPPSSSPPLLSPCFSPFPSMTFTLPCPPHASNDS